MEWMEEEDRSGESKVGRRRVMTTWAVGEAWDRFCTSRKEVLVRAFSTVGLSLPIDGSRDAELSIKGIDTERLANDLQAWHIGGLEEPSLDDDSSEAEESIPSDEDNPEFIFYEAGPLREELQALGEQAALILD